MFTWICPQCGREVPPSYEACPDCAAREKAAGQPAAAAVQPAAPTPPSPTAPPPVAYAPPAAPVFVPPAAAPFSSAAYAAEPPRAGLPTWLLAILFAFAFVGLGAGVYWAINYFKGGTQAASTPAAAPATTAQSQAAPNPLQKYVEVSGIRFVDSPTHQTEARFVVINHSDADITDLAGTVKIWGRTAKAEEEPAGNFSFKLPSLHPNESKEATAPLDTKLKAYELPDWQNIVTQVQITSPQ
ncbi:MAG: hypothetical protein ACLP59_35565 [Bryobacteraceae bacterium]